MTDRLTGRAAVCSEQTRSVPRAGSSLADRHRAKLLADEGCWVLAVGILQAAGSKNCLNRKRGCRDLVPSYRYLATMRARRVSPPGAATSAPTSAPNADHAWKLLSLVNEWIRHSDSKAAVTLAFTAAMATLLFNLARAIEHRFTLLDLSVVIACFCLAATGTLCGLTLTPRIKDKDADPQAINRLFYVSIAKNYSGRRPEYADALKGLSENPSELIRDLADQIHANAKIATVKAKFAKWAIRSGLTSGAVIGVTAILIGLTNS